MSSWSSRSSRLTSARSPVPWPRPARRSAASAGVSAGAQAHAFAELAGFAVILKPRSGAGASGTVRVDDFAGLDHALGVFGGQGVDSIAVEEFVEGHEGFYDTITIDGQVALDFVS